MVRRCINIDWLEVYCNESVNGFPHDADYFRVHGWSVLQREYGTRIYREMFTLYDADGEPCIEIRRNPYSLTGDMRGVFTEYSCHVRLSNRACYMNSPVDYLRQFLAQYDYTLMKIFRIDICLDFTRFDRGDDPKAFLLRYMSGKFSKINQANISAHGRDLWDGRDWNSVSWGQPKSMVSTKMYNKSLELEQRHDKPYIRQAWFAAGLIDDEVNCTKRQTDGSVIKPDVWRVEFSIKSSAAKFYIIENCNGRKKKRESKPHTLSVYDSREKLITVFASLSDHYFHFKHFEKDQRKDRCQDKVLFQFSPRDICYKIDRQATHTPKSTALDTLLRRLREYMLHCIDPDVNRACQTIVEHLEQGRIVHSYSHHFDARYIKALQLTIAQRLDGSNPNADVMQLYETIKELDSFF